MAKTVTIKLTGLAEKFVEEMKNQGLTEGDVISQGLGILEQIWRTKRVALVKESFWLENNGYPSSTETQINYPKDENVLEYYFHVQTPKSMTPDHIEIGPRTIIT